MAVHNAKLHEDVAQLNRELRIAIIAAEFNNPIMAPLIEKNTALLSGEGFEKVDVFRVPGCFELPGQARQILEKGVYNMVIVLGCVVRGQTPHFDYVCTECSRGIMDLTMMFDTPVIFGVLTCDTMEQAQARVDDNYAIYGLNYLAQRGKTDHILEQKYEEIMSQMGDMMEGEDLG